MALLTVEIAVANPIYAAVAPASVATICPFLTNIWVAANLTESVIPAQEVLINFKPLTNIGIVIPIFVIIWTIFYPLEISSLDQMFPSCLILLIPEATWPKPAAMLTKDFISANCLIDCKNTLEDF